MTIASALCLTARAQSYKIVKVGHCDFLAETVAAIKEQAIRADSFKCLDIYKVSHRGCPRF